MNKLIKPIALSLNVKESQVKNTLDLLEEGNTVPFIARYRKEKTGELDEEQILYIHKEFEYQVNLAKRKEDVLRMIESLGKLTEEIINEVNKCEKLSQVEDIYRPYKQKKKTRATEAVRKGLKPLADWILSLPKKGNIEEEASKFLSDDVTSIEEAIEGAKDIIAESVSDNAKLRWKIKDSISNYGQIVTKAKKNFAEKDPKKTYQMYYEFSERVDRIQPHRIMALERAESEKVVTVSFSHNVDFLIRYAFKGLVGNKESIVNDVIMEAVIDGLKRLAIPSVEREIRAELKEKAIVQSIDIFSLNLEKLIMQAPLKGKRILGFDPAYRTGCKLAILDDTGQMLEIAKIYPHTGSGNAEAAKRIMLKLLEKYPVDIIAIGNGTASRESETFVADLIKENNLNIQYTLVSEAGASVYSASELARAEFPNLQVEERSAISIARRVLDPLAELIKIDPESIGVGQYQHDLPKKQLKERLDFAIDKSVNRVGVDINTASYELLAHVSGINKKSAVNIVETRNANGRFINRKQILKVKGIGAKAYQQASGFLRVTEGSEILDQTSIHPESYEIAKKILAKLDHQELGSMELIIEINQLDIDALVKEFDSDIYTIEDILKSLKEPLRDYREDYEGPLLKSNILELEDLVVGDKLQGVVRNVVDFGAFVDIGLHEDGLVHISKMSKQRVAHPSDVLAVGDIIDVFVFKIDSEREKVQLSLIDPK